MTINSSTKNCLSYMKTTTTGAICTMIVCFVEVLWLSFPFFPSPFLQMTQFAKEKAGHPLKYNLSILSLPLSRLYPSRLFGLYIDLHWRSTCRKPCLILCLPRCLLDSRIVS